MEYKYYNPGYYPPPRSLFKVQCFRDWILSPSSCEIYSIGPNLSPNTSNNASRVVDLRCVGFLNHKGDIVGVYKTNMTQNNAYTGVVAGVRRQRLVLSTGPKRVGSI
jgi:hypothetical protein